MSQKKEKDVKEEYEKMKAEDHVLFAPDTYCGGCDLINEKLYILNNDKKAELKSIDHIPAIGNLINEVLVNARDHIIRLQMNKEKNLVSKIEINFNSENGEWSILNDGEGISIQKHSKEKVYNPELIFCHLLTSGNYDKSKKKIIGGKNGFGAKLVNIFSNKFTVETVDSSKKLKYIQTCENNMKIINPPTITKCNTKPYTKFTWNMDYKRFNIEKLSDDMVSLMIRRFYDIAGITDKKINVYYNKEKINIKSFQEYVELYPTISKKIYEKSCERWEFSVCSSDTDKFEQVSFVNGICTSKGGVHVDTLVKLLITGIVKYMKKKHKKDILEKYVKNHLSIYLNCVIEDPSFSSQIKDTLITPKSKFGSKPEISDKFIKELCDSGLSVKILQFSDFKDKTLEKKTNGIKKSKINIPKLDDANWAGGRKSDQCTLILTEGDSAKSMAIAGLSVVGRDKYGVFPLKGKILNVRDANIKQVMNNQEIINLKKIIGLESGKKYKDIKPLRYGKIMVMTDQDHDGSHIKGLLLNLFHNCWPELLELDYINSMVTPIVKATHKKNTKDFYTLVDYTHWREKKEKKKSLKKWNIKYYKGLGTSTSKEAKGYFKELKINQYKITEKTDQHMELAFKKTETDQRKEWLKHFDENKILDYNKKEISIDDFINYELIHFSQADNLRSIGSCVDGLKTSQRKILYSCFKRKLYSEIKVAQLSGYVSEQSAYHHGEVSLQGAIIGMAQNFVGSNNINLLEPNGQFGTRIMGGSDSASARYIHTQLNPLIDYIYPSSDFPLLNYLNDDGVFVEPTWYCPIIPMVLINGMVGIGTGFSTSVPQFNPLDCVKNIKRKLNNENYLEMKPYYKGFKGKIIKDKNKNNYITKGNYKIEDDKIIITELPIGIRALQSTHSFKEYIESIMNQPDSFIVDYENHSTDETVKFIINVNDELLFDNQYKKNNVIEEKFKLKSTVSLTNLHLYDEKGVIHKYETIYHIFDHYFDTRMNLYKKRKEHQINALNKELQLLKSKLRFIELVIDDEIIIYKKSKDTLIQSLSDLEFPFYEDNQIINHNKEVEIKNEYNYLLNLSVYSFTLDKVQELKDDVTSKNEKLLEIQNMEIKDIWLQELDTFELKFKRFAN